MHRNSQRNHSKNTNSIVAIAKTTHQQPTCQNAAKRVRCCCSRCYFSRAMGNKIIQKHRTINQNAINKICTPVSLMQNGRFLDRFTKMVPDHFGPRPDNTLDGIMQIGTSESRAVSPFVRNPKSKINYGLKKRPAHEVISDFSNSNLNFSKQ